MTETKHSRNTTIFSIALTQFSLSQ